MFVEVIEDFEEQIRIAPAPRVDGLLGVSDIEKAAVLCGIHEHFVDEGFQDFPLRAARILKLVEEPMLEFLIDAVGGGGEPGQVPGLAR